MPDSTEPESSSAGRGVRTPRPDDLRNLKLGSRRRTDPEHDHTEATGQTDDRSPHGPSSTSGDWVEPGQHRPSASGSEWIDPRNRSKEPVDGSDQNPWQRMFGGAGNVSDAALPGKPPSHWKRLIAYIIDATIIAAALSVIFPAVLGRPYIDIDEIRAWIEASSNRANIEHTDGDNLMGASENASDSNPFPFLAFNMATGLNLAAYLLYHGVLLGLVGATVGKRLLGITVCGTNGMPIGIPRGIVRSIVLFLTATLVAVGFLVVLIHPRRRALHDLVAGSYPVERSHSFKRVDQT